MSKDITLDFCPFVQKWGKMTFPDAITGEIQVRTPKNFNLYMLAESVLGQFIQLPVPERINTYYSEIKCHRLKLTSDRVTYANFCQNRKKDIQNQYYSFAPVCITLLGILAVRLHFAYMVTESSEEASLRDLLKSSAIFLSKTPEFDGPVRCAESIDPRNRWAISWTPENKLAVVPCNEEVPTIHSIQLA